MRWRNTPSTYGLVSILLHWLLALVILGLFFLGDWMIDLNYYSPYYHKAPFIHKSLGALLLFFMLLRLAWRLFTPQPEAIETHSSLIQLASRAGHLILYLLIFGILLSGYLLSTAKGDPINVFNLFSLPATITSIPNQADLAGDIHKILAWTLMLVIAGHALAALKHHFIDKDATLKRMLGKK